MDTSGFEDISSNLSSMLDDPARVDEARNELALLRRRIQKKRIEGLSPSRIRTLKCRKCGHRIPITSDARPLKLRCPSCGKTYNLKGKREAPVSVDWDTDTRGIGAKAGGDEGTKDGGVKEEGKGDGTKDVRMKEEGTMEGLKNGGVKEEGTMEGLKNGRMKEEGMREGLKNGRMKEEGMREGSKKWTKSGGVKEGMIEGGTNEGKSETTPPSAGESLEVVPVKEVCPFCGAVLLPESTFCGMCGKNL